MRLAVNTLLKELDTLKSTFGKAAARSKIRILSELEGSSFSTPQQVERYHDLLCFVRAYPDNRAVINRCEKSLGTFAHIVTPRVAARLVDSGIVNTAVFGTFSYELTTLLVAEFGKAVRVDTEVSEIDRLWGVLPLLVSWPEVDTLDNAPEMETIEWLRRARAEQDGNELATVLRLFRHSRLDVEVQRFLFESLEWWIEWRLKDAAASRTRHRVNGASTYFQTGPLKARSPDLGREITKRAAPLRKAGPKLGEQYVRDIKLVLGVRVRELYSLTGSNPNEVYTCDPGRGLRVVLFGNNPDIRLPIESNFGAMLIRNGMPVGYGVSAMLFGTAEIAINIFPAFRSGESAFTIEQFFRIFHQHFGATKLIVRKYQLGYENDEALESGSFWFYYKLGFRAIDKKVRSLAEVEAKKIRSRPAYRSSIAMLKRLCQSDVVFDAGTARSKGSPELAVASLGLAVSSMIATRHKGNRADAIAQSVAALTGMLNLHPEDWTVDERRGLERLAPLFACLPGLERWSPSDRQLLGQIIRAKGGTSERQFVLLCQRHDRLEKELHRLAAQYPLE